MRNFWSSLKFSSQTLSYGSQIKSIALSLSILVLSCADNVFLFFKFRCADTQIPNFLSLRFVLFWYGYFFLLDRKLANCLKWTSQFSEILSITWLNKESFNAVFKPFNSITSDSSEMISIFWFEFLSPFPKAIEFISSWSLSSWSHKERITCTRLLKELCFIELSRSSSSVW